jgi:hypothetical protein
LRTEALAERWYGRRSGTVLPNVAVECDDSDYRCGNAEGHNDPFPQTHLSFRLVLAITVFDFSLFYNVFTPIMVL